MRLWHFSPVTPVVDPDAALHERIRLLDLSLIVVGDGDVAAELVRRRRLSGGRVCWLRTQRQPKEEPSTSVGTIGSLSTVDSTVPWDLESFRWRPSTPRHQWCGCGWATHSWKTSGADVVHLRDWESYKVTVGGDDRAAGIQVVDCKRDGAPVLWEISGVVIFAGERYRPLKETAVVCDTFEAAQDVEVGVDCEDAKPFVTVSPLHVLTVAVVVFVELSLFFVLMGAFEPHLEPEQVPWWRMTAGVFSALPFMFASAAHVGPLAMGTTMDSRLAMVMACLGTLCIYCAILTPLGWIGDKFYTWNIFTATSLTFGWYTIVVILVLSLQNALGRGPQAAEEHRKIRWRAHFYWFLWMVVGTQGSAATLYAVAVLYLNLSSIDIGLGAVALPLLTSLVELAVVIGTIQAYKALVMGTRSKTWSFTFAGDQRQMVMFPVGLTHSFSESTRLASILVPTVKSPCSHWAAPLLMTFFFNIFIRSHHFTRLLSCIMPSRYGWLFAPDAGTVLLNEARLCLGYLRFVPLLALGLANLCLQGFDQWPLFNSQATLLVATALLLEVAEDLIVTSGVLQSDAWKAKLVPTYRGLDPLHPSSIMGFDGDGVQPACPGINFSGVRSLKLSMTVLIVNPACLFTYNLLGLLLGAGFVHGACSSPLEQRQGLLGSFAWTSPLEC